MAWKLHLNLTMKIILPSLLEWSLAFATGVEAPDPVSVIDLNEILAVSIIGVAASFFGILGAGSLV